MNSLINPRPASRAPVLIPAHGIRAHAKRATRERISRTALPLFFEKGFNETAVSDIVACSGVSSRTFFRYFPRKEDVLLEVLDTTNARWLDMMRELPMSLSVYQLLDASLPAWIIEMGPLFLDIMALASTSASLFAAITSRRTVWESRIAALLVQRSGNPAMNTDQAEVWAMLGMGILQLAWHGMEREKDLASTTRRLLSTLRNLPGLQSPQ